MSTKTKTLDLASFDTVTKSNDGVWIAIVNPFTGEESNVEFLMLGYDSDIYSSWRDEQSKKSQQYMIEQMARAASKRKTKEEAKLELEDDIELLVRLTKDWKNAEWEGEPLKFTEKNVRMVYTKNAIIRTQLLNAVNDRERFFMKTLNN